MHCAVCARRSRYDVLGRHARRFHDGYKRVLRKGKKPRDPYYKDWVMRVMNPDPARRKFHDGSQSTVSLEYSSDSDMMCKASGKSE